jgi:hypothetical protein
MRNHDRPNDRSVFPAWETKQPCAVPANQTLEPFGPPELLSDLSWPQHSRSTFGFQTNISGRCLKYLKRTFYNCDVYAENRKDP